MLSDQDVLLLKLALEWELIDARGYRHVVEAVRAPQVPQGGVGRSLRQIGVAGERVGQLAELVATSGVSGMILARCDLEDEIASRTIEAANMLPKDKVERAKNEVKGLARAGELSSLSEVLVKRRWIEVPVGVELRKRARERVATCSKCRRHYIVEPSRASGGRFRCRECQIPLEPGRGCPSAVDAARGLQQQESRPAPMPDASQVMRLAPNEMAELRRAAEAARSAEETKTDSVPPPQVAAARVTPPGVGTGTVRRPLATTPPPPKKSPDPGTSQARKALEVAKSPDPGASGTRKALEAPKPATGKVAGGTRTNLAPVGADPFAKPAVERTERSGSETVADEEDAPQAARWESVHDIESEPLAAAVASFGDYEILSEIARGGMGIVYKARRKGSPKLLALKVLISGVDATEEQVRRFEREGEAARRFRHPNIVRVYDAGRHEGYHYIAMEFVEGKSLEDLVHDGPLDPKRAAAIVRDMATAVHHMHQAGVIHRDLKPGNILLDKDGAPKLIDFGLAKTIDRQSKLTRSGAAVGTPYYMPPEQVRGEGVTAQSDVYALGAILYELVVGDVPFKAENPIELYHKIASSELVLPSTIRDGLPDDLETIVAKSMEKRPDDRYPTAVALADDLDLFLNGKTIQAKRAGAVAVAARKARKHVLIGLAFFLAIAGTLGAVLLWQKLGLGGKKGSGDAAASVLYEEGKKELDSGKYAAAVSFLENAHRKDPEDLPIMIALARAYAKTNEPDRAVSVIERAVEKGLDDPKQLEFSELDSIRQNPKFVAAATKVAERGPK